MIGGIGMDLCDVNRIRTMSHTHKQHFIQKYFSEIEQSYIYEKCISPDETVAGMFAAKEAFVKFLGTGFQTVDLPAIEILHDSNGKPYFHLSGWAKN